MQAMRSREFILFSDLSNCINLSVGTVKLVVVIQIRHKGWDRFGQYLRQYYKTTIVYLYVYLLKY